MRHSIHPVCESLGLTQCVGDILGLMWIRGRHLKRFSVCRSRESAMSRRAVPGESEARLREIFKLKGVGDVEACGSSGLLSMAVSPS